MRETTLHGLSYPPPVLACDLSLHTARTLRRQHVPLVILSLQIGTKVICRCGLFINCFFVTLTEPQNTYSRITQGVSFNFSLSTAALTGMSNAAILVLSGLLSLRLVHKLRKTVKTFSRGSRFLLQYLNLGLRNNG